MSIGIFAGYHIFNSVFDLGANGTAGLERSDENMFGKYSLEMRALKSHYMAQHPNYDKKASYLFVVPSFSGTGDLKGFMVRGRSVGFVVPSADMRTYAHELGHGVFGLEHTFPEIPQTPNIDNLMAYGTGTHLTHEQWKIMHARKPAYSWFDSEEDGSIYSYGYFKIGDAGILQSSYTLASVSQGTNINFVTPNGKIIQLPNNTKVSFAGYLVDAGTSNMSSASKNGIGVLMTFYSADGKYWRWDFESNTTYKNETKTETYVATFLTGVQPVIIGVEESDCKVTLYKGDYTSSPTPMDYVAQVALTLASKTQIGFKQIPPEDCKGSGTNCTPDPTHPLLVALNAVTSSTPAADIRTTIRTNFNSSSYCAFAGLAIAQRKLILEKLLSNSITGSPADNDYWYTMSVPATVTAMGEPRRFILEPLIMTTPVADRVALLQGFQANSYQWLNTMWNEANNTGNGVNYEDIAEVLTQISAWVIEYQGQLNITPTQKSLILTSRFDSSNNAIFNDPNASTFGIFNSTTETINYPAGLQDFYLGLRSSSFNDYDFPDLQYRLKNITTTNEIAFLNGKISLKQGYTIEETQPKPNADLVVAYEEELNPFEPMKVIVADNFNELGLVKSKQAMLPSYMVMILQKNITRSINSTKIRTACNVVMIAAATITAIPSGGTSFVAATTYIAGGAAAIDIVATLHRNSVSPTEYAANLDYYKAWDMLYHSANMLNLVASTPGAINSLRSINVAKAWQKLVEMRNNPTIWNNLAAGAKQDWRNLVTAIGNQMGITINTSFGSFIKKTFTIPKGTPPSGGGGGSIASSTDVITMADMAKIFPEATAAANSITNATSIIRVAPGLAKTDAATLAATQTTISSSTMKELIPNTLKYDTQLTTSITTAEINFFVVPKTTLAATSTPGQTFGYVKSWEVMFGTEKVYFVTFTAQNANQLNNTNLPITALLTAVNAQGQPVNIATGAVVATSTSSSSCQVCPIIPPRTTQRVLTPATCQALQQLRTSTNNQLGINALCNKITSQLTLKEVTDQLNTYQTSLTANTIANDFLNDIKPTTLPNRHISSNLNSNFGLEQLKAWKKLHTSGFETDFEYIRTLSFKQTYIGNNDYEMDMTNCSVSGIITGSFTNPGGFTLTHGTFITTFSKDSISAKGGTGGGINKANRNQLLNVIPLIPNFRYNVTDSNDSPYVTYLTDAQGRVREIRANLHIGPSKRDNSLSSLTAQSTGPKDGRGTPADNGGHMIRAEFDGPVELINYFAQDAQVNQSGGDWFKMEDEWSRVRRGLAVVDNNTTPPTVLIPAITGGKSVSVNIKPHFPSTTGKRPDWFDVEYKYGGVPQNASNNANFLSPILNP